MKKFYLTLISILFSLISCVNKVNNLNNDTIHFIPSFSPVTTSLIFDNNELINLKKYDSESEFNNDYNILLSSEILVRDEKSLSSLEFNSDSILILVSLLTMYENCYPVNLTNIETKKANNECVLSFSSFNEHEGEGGCGISLPSFCYFFINIGLKGEDLKEIEVNYNVLGENNVKEFNF